MRRLLAMFLAAVMIGWVGLAEARGSDEMDKIVVTALNIETVDEKEMLEIVLNDQIRIREIEMGEFAGRTMVKFPAFVTRRGRVFPHVEVLKEELHREIIRAVESKKPSAERPGELRWEITRLAEFGGPGLTRAHFSITFNEALKINGRIRERRADGGLWIAWPARPPREGEERWQRQVRILDQELLRNIEEMLLESYKKL